MRRLIILIVLTTALPVHGHHTFFSIYDPDVIEEVEGTVSSVAWRNPHIQFTLIASSGDESELMFEFEGNGKSMLSRMGVPDEPFSSGDILRVAGHPARRQGNRYFATNVLLPDGTELTLRPDAAPRWQSDAIGTGSSWLDSGEANAETGIFRVWSTNLASRASFPLWNRSYPLTDRARESRASWDPDSGTILDCNNFGMPTIMATPDPIQFVDFGDHIELRIESFNVVRTIHLEGERSEEVEFRSPLGFSNGRWDGNTLVVTTTMIDWPYFDQSGIPLGSDASIVETFSTSLDGRMLEYQSTITDPETFTDTVVLTKHWVWRPDETVLVYSDDATCNIE